MSLQTSLVALLSPIFTGGFFPKGSKASPKAPYGTFFRVAATEDVTLDPNGGTGNASNTRLQIDVYEKTYLDAQAKAAAVKAALKGWAVENVVLLEQDSHEPDTGLHGVMIDISTWHL